MMNERIKKARDFAIENHGNQLYDKDKPYVYHLDKVVEILKPYGSEAQIIGYLHDVVEDTDVELYEIEDEFGRFILTCVDILTDEPGNTRKDRKLPTYKKVTFFTSDTEKYDVALIVKVADRLSNILEGKKNDMYKKEHEEFRNTYYKQNLCDEIWDRIEKILFNER